MTEAQREREAIVAWLRATANIFDPRDPTNLALSWAYLDASNAIERGEHLKSSATASHSDDTGMSGTGQPTDATRGSEGGIDHGEGAASSNASKGAQLLA